ncbi:MAG: bifunctional folylpolyglutamate synthase/dihydrofolate synthase [Myxococcota bacterium]|nr:bifunctional folylpolyglutamate synthase/dihydrofolate synthase [Myxococcota bacterium]
MSGRVSNLREASDWLEGLINFERAGSYAQARLNLGPIRRLLDRLGNPEKTLSIVHVAGSKGKGSTCLLAEAILGAAGERVGTFTSPHLESWCERFRIAGRQVDGSTLAEAVEGVRPHVEALKAEDPENAPTFFDATTATALLLFERAQVSRVLLEVGLGGRLDSTNAVQPAVTCITQIELEHTEKLGNTLSAIAGEKAGIIKPGVPCIAGPLAPEARDVVAERARSVGAPLFALGGEIGVQRLEESEWSRYEVGGDVAQAFVYRESDGFEFATGLAVLGEHQVDNAAIAIAALRRLGDRTDGEWAEAARVGLASVHLPGRLEVLREAPWLVVDSAHTRESAASLRRVLDGIPAARIHFVLSISRDKPSEEILTTLLEGADSVWATCAEPLRSMAPEELARLCARIAPGCLVRCEPDPRVAVELARGVLAKDDLLCCTGSVYLAGAARSVLGSWATG